MKTIDEFATDYAQDKYLPVQTYQAVMAGANYVLECIEEATNIYFDKELRNVIEQLKK